LIILILLGEEYILWSSTLYSFKQNARRELQNQFSVTVSFIRKKRYWQTS
jgi:hypothetical protein